MKWRTFLLATLPAAALAVLCGCNASAGGGEPAVALALHETPGHHRLHGVYAMTGMSQCLWAPNGFWTPPGYTQLFPRDQAPPTPPTGVGRGTIQTHFFSGVYTFAPDGKSGSAALDGRTIMSPYTLSATSPPPYAYASSPALAFDFTYTIDDEGRILFTTVPGSSVLSTGPLHGDISPGGQMLLVYCGTPVVIDFPNTPGNPQQMVCNISLTGFRRNE